MRIPLVLALLLPAFLSGCGNETTDYGPPTTFTLSGKVTYEDRIYAALPATDSFGFTDTAAKPVRLAKVEVLDATDATVATASTGADGSYTVQASGGSNEPMRLRVRAQTTSGAEVTVYDHHGNVTAASKGFTPGSSGTVTLDVYVTRASEVGGAFNILDIFTAGGEFTHARSGAYPPPLSAYWESGMVPPGMTTYFCHNGCTQQGIHILGGDEDDAGQITGDSDEYDDDVLLHEYGHFLEHSFGVLDSPGGAHALLDNTEDLRLAWSEGWASYTAGSIKDWMVTEGHTALSSENLPASIYVDTADNVAFIAHDFAQVPTDPDDEALVRQASNEGAIGKVLWDLHANYGTASVWTVFSEMLPVTPAGIPVSMEAFWDGWQASTIIDAATKTGALAYFQGRDMDYSEDAHDATGDDDANTTRTYASAEAHTLYKPSLATEADWVQFNVIGGKTYRVETFALLNGADTYLEIFDAGNVALTVNGAPVANDNHDGGDYIQVSSMSAQNLHDGCKLASRVEFVAPYTGVLLARVTRPEAIPAAAGRYGGYKLKIAEATPTSSPQCP